jgi:hypothetical protein
MAAAARRCEEDGRGSLPSLMAIDEGFQRFEREWGRRLTTAGASRWPFVTRFRSSAARAPSQLWLLHHKVRSERPETVDLTVSA